MRLVVRGLYRFRNSTQGGEDAFGDGCGRPSFDIKGSQRLGLPIWDRILRI